MAWYDHLYFFVACLRYEPIYILLILIHAHTFIINSSSQVLIKEKSEKMPKKEDTVHYTYLSGDYLGVSYEGRKNIFRFLLSQRKITREILHESSEPIPVLKDKPQKSIPVHKQIKNPKKKVPKISKKEVLFLCFNYLYYKNK